MFRQLNAWVWISGEALPVGIAACFAVSAINTSAHAAVWLGSEACTTCALPGWTKMCFGFCLHADAS